MNARDNIAPDSSENAAHGLEPAPSTSSDGNAAVAGSQSASTITISSFAGTSTISDPIHIATYGAVQTSTFDAAPQKHSGGKYNAGAVAGAAIGAAVGAALIAFLITWFLMRKHAERNSRVPSYRRRTLESTKDGIEINERPVALPVKQEPLWQAHIPRPADDRTLQQAAKSLFDHIDTHVDNFYQREAAHGVRLDSDALATVDSGYLPAPLEQLLQDPSLVLLVIKHCIASVFIRSITPAVMPDYSLLPGYLASMSPVKRATPREENVTLQAYSQWKILSNYICPKPDEDSMFLRSREASTSQIINLFDAAFGAWQKQSDVDSSALRHHQKSLAKLASNTGTLVVSHPSNLQFIWERRNADRSETTSHSSLVLYPGLVRTTDESGVPLTRWQELVLRQTVAL